MHSNLKWNFTQNRCILILSEILLRIDAFFQENAGSFIVERSSIDKSLVSLKIFGLTLNVRGPS